MTKSYSALMQLKHIRSKCSENKLYFVEMPNSGEFVLYRQNPNPEGRGIRLGAAKTVEKLQTLVDKFCKKVKYSDKILAETVSK